MNTAPTESQSLLSFLKEAETPEMMLGFGIEATVYALPAPMQDYVLRVSKEVDLKATTILSVPSSYHGLALHMYGQAYLTSGKVSIHPRVGGVSLAQFLEENKDDAMAMMASWPQQTFDHLMFQAKLATEKGAMIDPAKGNFMIDVSREIPKIEIIDLRFPNSHIEYSSDERDQFNRPYTIMVSFMESLEGDAADRKKLIEKFTLSAEKEKFGSAFPYMDLYHLTKGLLGKGAEFEDALRKRLNTLPRTRIDTSAKTQPAGLAGIVGLSLKDATVGDGLIKLREVAEADRRAHLSTLR